MPDSSAIITEKTSGLAIASLVCSLLSLILCIGWLPGIICGHLAKSRLRRNPSLKGNGLATAGLVIGYLILIFEVGTAAVYIWRISTAMKHGYENVRQNLATNNIITQIQTAIVSNADESAQSVKPMNVVTNNRQTETTEPGWTSDISKVSFPDYPARGKIHGMDFTTATAAFRNGDLRISSANGMSIQVIRGLGDSIEGQDYEFQPTDNDKSNPLVRMYYLFFASQNSTGNKIAEHIFNKYRNRMA